MGRNLSKPANGAPVRTFLAVELPEPARASLATTASQLEPHRSILKLVAPELLHVTIRFLGQLTERQLNSVEEAAAAAAAQVEPFALQLGGMGSFPERRAPRVVWAGLADDEGYGHLQILFAAVERELAARGFPPEGRAFAPHITLARVREGVPAEDTRPLSATLEAIHNANGLRDSFEVRQLTVMRSDLSSRGPRYTTLTRAPLRAPTSTGADS